MERIFIDVIKKASKEMQDFFKTERFSTNKYLEFNFMCFCYFLERMQLQRFSKSNTKFNFDAQSFHRAFLDEVVLNFQKLNPKQKELDVLLKFADESKHIGVWSSNYISMIEALLDHKGMLRSEIETLIYQLETEFKQVISAFRDAPNSSGKYILPYKSYITFFLFPIIFLEEEDGVFEKLHKDFFQEIVRFLPIYAKLSNHIQQFLALENLIIFRDKEIA